MKLLKGVISNLKIRRRSQNFVMSEMQHEYMEATAAGAAMFEMGAQAIGVLNMSANSEEEADWIEFDLDGRQMQGWLWKMPILNGEEVEVVAERAPKDRYIVYSIRRSEDDVIAVYPHATAGRSAKYRSIMKMMLWLFLIIYSIVAFSLLDGLEGVELRSMVDVVVIGRFSSLAIFWELFYISYRKFIGFCKLAEEIFLCYGWRNVSKIDLVKSSKKVRPERIAAEYGRHYFLYNPESEQR